MDLHNIVVNKTVFNRHAYSINRPLGIWQAKIDKAVYSGPGSSQGGRCSGIHLYVERKRSGEKICLFIPVLPGFDPSTIAENFNAGDFIEIEIAISKSGLPVVKTLRKLDQPTGPSWRKKLPHTE
ncbi:MAG: hypothetical protein C5B47_01705 [Verrucomicrobia bacterium]|nr:MAG: hypothetical protein C5B47_01705 [Verrucomicrobiota bacterium]